MVLVSVRVLLLLLHCYFNNTVTMSIISHPGMYAGTGGLVIGTHQERERDADRDRCINRDRVRQRQTDIQRERQKEEADYLLRSWKTKIERRG